MDMTPQEYKAYVKQKAKKSPILRDTALALSLIHISEPTRH